MKPVHLMHFADLHLDHVLSEYGPAARRQRRAELLQCFDFIVDKALSSGVSILLVAGDLLCARSVSSSTLEAVKRGFARLGAAGVFVALVPGEAEEPDGLEALREVASGNNVHLFMGDEWSRVEPIPGVSLWGLRTTGRNASISVLAGLRVDGPGIHIGLMHATTEGQGPDGRGLSTVTGADLAASGLHYLALGHYHSVLNCSVGPSACWYPGSPAHHDFSTRGERHVLKVTLGDGPASVSRITVPARPHRVVVVDVSGKPADYLRRRLADLANLELCLRAVLEGELSAGLAWLPARLEREFAQSFFHLDIVDNTRPARPSLPGNGPEALLSKERGSGGDRQRDRALAIALAALEEVGAVDHQKDGRVG